MTTQQNDTAALTDEQLEGVAGGFDIGPISHGGRMRVGFRSIEPNPSPYPRPWRTAVRVGFRSIAPLPSP